MGMPPQYFRLQISDCRFRNSEINLNSEVSNLKYSGNRSSRGARQVFRETTLRPAVPGRFARGGRRVECDPRVRPLTESVERANQGTAFLSERIFHTNRRVGHHRALDDALLFELLQTFTQH